MANLCSLPVDGNLLHMHQGCEVLYILHSPYLVTEEVGDDDVARLSRLSHMQP